MKVFASCICPHGDVEFAAVRSFAAKGGYKIEYLPYRWGLNDQGDRGRNYSRLNLFFDSLF